MRKAPAKPKEPEYLNCGNCDCEFVRSSRTRHNEYGWFCSPVCLTAITESEGLMRQLPLQQPCPTCDTEFRSHTPRVYCTVECFKDSEDYVKMSREAFNSGFVGARVYDYGVRSCLQCTAEFTAFKGRVGPGRAGQFCGKVCQQRWDVLRFDRWFAHPVVLGFIQGYDEFLVGRETLQCPYPGCTWTGSNLSNHANKFHGIPTMELKRAAGFSDSTGLICASLKQRQRVTTDRLRQEGRLTLTGLRGWRLVRNAVWAEGGRTHEEANAEASRRYSEQKGHVQLGGEGEKIYTDRYGRPKKNLQGQPRLAHCKSPQYREHQKKKYAPSLEANARCACGDEYRKHFSHQKLCSPCSQKMQTSLGLRATGDAVVTVLCAGCRKQFQRPAGYTWITTCRDSCEKRARAKSAGNKALASGGVPA